MLSHIFIYSYIYMNFNNEITKKSREINFEEFNKTICNDEHFKLSQKNLIMMYIFLYDFFIKKNLTDFDEYLNRTTYFNKIIFLKYLNFFRNLNELEKRVLNEINEYISELGDEISKLEEINNEIEQDESKYEDFEKNENEIQEKQSTQNEVIQRLENVPKVREFVEQITLDDYDNSVCYDEDTFDLYIDIARNCHNAVPLEIMKRKEFEKFQIQKNKIPKGQYVFKY